LHDGEKVSLQAGKPQIRKIHAIQPRPRPSQPPGREPTRRRPSPRADGEPAS